MVENARTRRIDRRLVPARSQGRRVPLPERDRGPVASVPWTRDGTGHRTYASTMTEQPDPPASGVPRFSTTLVFALAAIVAALIAMFGDDDSFGPITVTFALVGLLPWALESGGVRLRPLLFWALAVLPVAMIVLVDRNPGGMFPMMLAVVWIASTSTNRAVTGLTVASGAAIVLTLAAMEGTTHETGAVYFVGGIGVAWLAGSMLRRQEILLQELQAAHDRQRDHAAAAERTRIAREVHDVVAHSLTITMLHVTGARRMLRTDPTRAGEALERAEHVGRESLDSIRQIVGLLRADTPVGDVHEPATTASEAPLPALGDIPALVEQYREAGLSVEADLRLHDIDTDPATGLTVFRVVQEALSNVLQYAPGEPMQLRVAADTDRCVLGVVAENPTTATPTGNRPDRTGLGLRGMAERVRAAGGSVTSGPTDHQTWRVEAELPLRRVTAAT
jgi:signal transduction histidine kinase